MKIIAVAVLLTFCAVLAVAQQKPGACPYPPTSVSTYSNCRVDDNCRSDLKCCTTRGGANVCTAPVVTLATSVYRPPLQGTPPKSGKCPPPFSKPTTSNCIVDTNCQDDLKCCKTLGRATVCLKPLAGSGRSMSPPGSSRCPEPQKHPGAWVCGNMCGMDSDCSTGTKCCENRCGARVCTAF